MERLSGSGKRRPEVWGVLGIILIVLLMPALWFFPLQMKLAYEQERWQAHLQLQVGVWFFHWKRQFDLTHQASTALQRLVERWRETGEPIPVTQQQAARRVPLQSLGAIAGRPLGYLGRRTFCPDLSLAALVGGGDAMESALMVGSLWALVGATLGFVRESVGVRIPSAQVDIRPSFATAGLRVRGRCILQIRLGHAMVAGVWLLGRAVRSREVRAWVRQSRSRKGVEGSGRTPD